LGSTLGLDGDEIVEAQKKKARFETVQIVQAVGHSGERFEPLERLERVAISESLTDTLPQAY
jgi:hypothetical protein